MTKKERSSARRDPVDPCSMSTEDGIIASLTELREALKKREPLERKFTMRTVDLEIEPSEYSSERVRETRERLNASQAVFAALLGVSTKTVQGWERGSSPPKMARRLLDTINDDPASWLARLARRANHTAAS
ncbi:MAG: helix-turn-helix domain-containing protein [Phycisphaerales bacterium]|nr:helix-turn-helix domain-containing protein [Phycisphaerales bacterium]